SSTHSHRHLPPSHSFPTRRSSDLGISIQIGHPSRDFAQPTPDSTLECRGKCRRWILLVRVFLLGLLLRLGLFLDLADGRRRRLADRKSTRLNSSHQIISYAVFCLK